MVFKKLIYDITLQFLEAWNSRDFDRIGSFLTPEVVFESPNISRILPENQDNRLNGRVETLNYLSYFASIFPAFYFDNNLTEVRKEDRLVIMKGILQHNNKTLEAHYTVNEYGKFQHIQISYPDGFE